MIYFAVSLLSQGKKREIELYAENKQEAKRVVKLKCDGIIIKVQERPEPLENQLKRFREDLFKNFKKKRIKPDVLISATGQLAVMINAGISIYDSLSEIAKATDDKTLKMIFFKLADDINAGHSFSAAMEFFRYELGSLSIAMVQLGEKTGNLGKALYGLSHMLEEIRTNMIKFKKAMAYPRNVLIAMAIAFSILLTYVIPQFKNIFSSLGADLPLPTLILLSLSEIFLSYGPLIILSTLSFTFVLKYLINTHVNIKLKWHQLLLKIVLLKNIIIFSTLNRFTLVFAELIRAGIPIADALDTSIEMIDNLPLKYKLQSLIIKVEKGGTLHKGLQETELFENMIIQMFRAGEESGTLENMVQKVAQYYKMRFDAIIDGLSEAIEPILLFFIAGMVTLLALGIFMPMWDMGNALQGRH